jgi:hypothetical protein
MASSTQGNCFSHVNLLFMIYFGNCSLRLFVLTCTHIARSSFIAAVRPNIQLLKHFSYQLVQALLVHVRL